MARIIAGVTSSHVPAIGAAIDNKKTEEPYWKRVFSGFLLSIAAPMAGTCDDVTPAMILATF